MYKLRASEWFAEATNSCFVADPYISEKPLRDWCFILLYRPEIFHCSSNYWIVVWHKAGPQMLPNWQSVKFVWLSKEDLSEKLYIKVIVSYMFWFGSPFEDELMYCWLFTSWARVNNILARHYLRSLQIRSIVSLEISGESIKYKARSIN